MCYSCRVVRHTKTKHSIVNVFCFFLLLQRKGDDGVLLFPSFPIVAPYHHQSLFTNTFDFLYYGIINSVGLPSTQIPLGLNSQGLPTGVQIVANHNMDHLTIGMAEYFETNLGGWVAPFWTYFSLWEDISCRWILSVVSFFCLVVSIFTSLNVYFKIFMYTHICFLF